MPLTEERALEILQGLIAKPETQAQDIPRIWSEIINVYNTTFAPAPEPVKKKRRRGPANPNIGWPAGVSRADYNAWKAIQQDKGVTENLNPQEYKRQFDAGLVGDLSAPAAKASTSTAKASKAEPKAKAAPKAKANSKK